MGEKESLNSMGLTPLRLSKASSHGSSSRSSRSLNGADRQNSSRSSNGGNSARSSSSAPDKLHSRKSYTPDSSSKSGKVTAGRLAGLGLAHRVVQDPGLHRQKEIKTANIRTIMAKTETLMIMVKMVLRMNWYYPLFLRSGKMLRQMLSNGLLIS